MNLAARVVMALLSLITGCATDLPPRAFFHEDQNGRYYETQSGRILRIEQDGTVLDITCAEPEIARGLPREDVVRVLCPTGKVTNLGKAKKVAGDWDLRPYDIAPESGTCKPLFSPLSDSWTSEKRHSCANLFWEIPAAVVVYPTIAVLAVGIITAPVWVPLLILSSK
ncbi:MAG: hypothetical protein AB7G48_07705 [Nitrospiraceae bacterium]